MDPMPTSAEVAEIAREAVAARKAGHSTVTLHGTNFDLLTGGWCLRFVGRCHTAAARKHGAVIGDLDFDRFPWFARYASEASRSLLHGGSGFYGPYGKTDHPTPGDIICLSPGFAPPGHIGIFLGGGQFAENTSSTSRGPGTVISSLDDVASRIQGYARVLPPAEEKVLRVIYPPDAGAAGIVPCDPELVNGKLRGNLAEFAAALGFEVVWNAAQKKVYVSKRA